MFVNRRRLWAPKASHIPPVTLSFFLIFFFFPFFSTFLSFSLLLYLFFFRAKSSLTDHSHAQHSFCFLSIQCSFCSFCFVLPLFTHTPTQAERSSALIFDHMLKSSTTRSFSSSLLSYSFFDLAGASKSASTAMTDLRWKRFDLEAHSSIWKLCCRC